MSTISRDSFRKLEIFVNIEGPYRRKSSNDISSAHNKFTPKIITHSPRDGLYQAVQKVWNFQFFFLQFLAKQSSWNHNSPGVRRPSVCGIDHLNLLHRFLWILVVTSPGPYAHPFFDFFNVFGGIFTNIFRFRFLNIWSTVHTKKLRLGFLKINFENWNFNNNYWVLFSLTWDPMGVKISKRYSSHKSQPKVFKLVLNFTPNGPHKTTFCILEILSFCCVAIFCSNISDLESKSMSLRFRRIRSHKEHS